MIAVKHLPILTFLLLIVFFSQCTGSKKTAATAGRALSINAVLKDFIFTDSGGVVFRPAKIAQFSNAYHHFYVGIVNRVGGEAFFVLPNIADTMIYNPHVCSAISSTYPNIFKVDEQYYELKKHSNKQINIELLKLQNNNIYPEATAQCFTKLPQNIQFTLLDNSIIDASAISKSKKYTYVDVWGTWCIGCLQEIPYLAQLHQNYSHKVQILSLSYNDEREKLEEFIKRKRMIWTQGLSSVELNNQLLTASFPYGLLLSPTGKVVLFDTNAKSVLDYFDKN